MKNEKLGIIDKDNIEEFYTFITKRQHIWYNRFVFQMSRPSWTTDPILKKYKFTNVYRILDMGTQYLLDNILHKGSNLDVLFNIIIYRIFNKIDTYKIIGFTKIDDWDEDKVLLKLKKYKEKGNKIFTGAYMVNAQLHRGTNTTAGKYAKVITTFTYNLHIMYYKVVNYKYGMERTHELFRHVYGIGDFLAYQIILDGMYGGVFPFKEDDWSIAGEGAKRGILYIFPDCDEDDPLRRGEKYLLAMKYLHQNQIFYFDVFKLEFKKFGGMEISLSNMQNCLCEYSKYKKAKLGTGRPRQKFRPSTKIGVGKALQSLLMSKELEQRA